MDQVLEGSTFGLQSVKADTDSVAEHVWEFAESGTGRFRIMTEGGKYLEESEGLLQLNEDRGLRGQWLVEQS